ncbi:ATP-dependent sacrificial sulfur transferase LarE [Actinophytocola sp.]|uniref:ATP-dependent sacrificial sulfur transferase LarE n=1 Tax=Actinophytocola sp. TaxID=1872138 RepID=UPI002D24FEA4|nr:ATP-dependent sacrificial sulfur transferase LarE [Actinophytocola sp.]HYQ68199.1 ATP-dependent sacrificial sulfur transferase LarE [Actinophytocola sp.]
MTARRLLAEVAGYGSVAVAYSGGADSALVLAAAVRALGAERVLAVTAVSESLAAAELAPAAAFAESLGVRHRTPRTNELASAGYRANGRDRCYFCKSTVLTAITATAAEEGVATVATGTNADDAVDPFRPGIRAGDERGVRTPLRDAGLTKEAVRAISREWSLPTAEKPATPCLASRVRYGLTITPYRLARVDRAETAVRAVLSDAGVHTTDLRVRDLETAVRVEIDAHLTARPLPALGVALTESGFTDVPVEIAPFRSGNLNRTPPVGDSGLS